MYNKKKRWLSLILAIGILTQSVFAVDYSYATKNTTKELEMSSKEIVYEENFIAENITQLNQKIIEMNAIYNPKENIEKEEIIEKENLEEEKSEELENSESTEDIDIKENSSRDSLTEGEEDIRQIPEVKEIKSAPKSISIKLADNFNFKNSDGEYEEIEKINFPNTDLEIDYNNNNMYEYSKNLKPIGKEYYISEIIDAKNIKAKNINIIGTNENTVNNNMNIGLLDITDIKNSERNDLVYENIIIDNMHFSNRRINIEENENAIYDLYIKNFQLNSNMKTINNSNIIKDIIKINFDEGNISMEDIFINDNYINDGQILINILGASNLIFKNSVFDENYIGNFSTLLKIENNYRNKGKYRKSVYDGLEFKNNHIYGFYIGTPPVRSLDGVETNSNIADKAILEENPIFGKARLIDINNLDENTETELKNMKFNSNNFKNNANIIYISGIRESFEKLGKEVKLSITNSEFNNNQIEHEESYIDYIKNIIKDNKEDKLEYFEDLVRESAFIRLSEIGNDIYNNKVQIDLANNKFNNNEFSHIAGFIYGEKMEDNVEVNISKNQIKQNIIKSEEKIYEKKDFDFSLINFLKIKNSVNINIIENIIEENEINGNNSIIKMDEVIFDETNIKDINEININKNSISNNKSKNLDNYILIGNISPDVNMNIKENKIMSNEIINNKDIRLTNSGILTINNEEELYPDIEEKNIELDNNDFSNNKLINMEAVLNISNNNNKNLSLSNSKFNNNDIEFTDKETDIISVINISNMIVMPDYEEVDDELVPKTKLLVNLENLQINNNKLNANGENLVYNNGLLRFNQIHEGVKININNSLVKENNIENIRDLLFFDERVVSQLVMNNTEFISNKLSNAKGDNTNNLIALYFTDRAMKVDMTNNLFEKNEINENGNIINLSQRHYKNFNSANNTFVENKIKSTENNIENLIKNNAILNFEDTETSVKLSNDNFYKNNVKNGSIIAGKSIPDQSIDFERINISENEIENILDGEHTNINSSIIGIYGQEGNLSIKKSGINNNILKGKTTILGVKDIYSGSFNMDNNTIYGNRLLNPLSSKKTGGIIDLVQGSELNSFKINNNTITNNEFPNRKAIVLNAEDIVINGEEVEDINLLQISNNIFSGNKEADEKNSNILINSDFEGLNNELMEKENIGFDNIKPNKVDNKDVFITKKDLDKSLADDPLLSETSDIKIGRKDSTENLKTVPIKPEGLADNTGLKIDNITEDQKDYPRDEEKTDMGSAEMKWLNYDFNGIKVEENSQEKIGFREFYKRDNSGNLVNYFNIINNKSDELEKRLFYKKEDSNTKYNEDNLLTWYTTKKLDEKYDFPNKITKDTTIYAGQPEEVIYILKGKDAEFNQGEDMSLEKLRENIIETATRNGVDKKLEVEMIYPNGEVINKDNISELTKEVQDKKITLKLGNITEEVTVKIIGKPVIEENDKTIVLASGSKYTDVLTATVLAYEKDAPILLSEENSLTKETLDEIKRINPKDIIISGGEDSISKEVENILKDYTVKRISGKDRYETAIKIGEEVRLLSPNKKDIALVDGTNFPDVITISTLASFNETPILLTQPNKLNQFTEEKIDEWKIENITIGGYYNSVSKGIEENLSKTKKVKRLGGIDRYETATLIGDEYRNITKAKENLIVVDGTNFPDGITVTSIANKLNGPILLTQPNVLNETTKNEMNEWKAKNVYVAGGINSVSEKVFNEIEAKERIAGKNRYETAVKISQKFYELNK